MKKSILTLPALGFAAVVVMSACAPGSSSPASSTTPDSVSTQIPTSDVAIELATTPESGAATKKIAEAFTKQHPNVTVNVTATSFEDYNKGINLQLDSDKAPDIALINVVGNTVKNNLVLDLDDYSNSYGWEKVYSSSGLSQWRVAEDGKTLGTGPLYAVPSGFSEVGLYYNKALAAKIGIGDAPKTLADFEEDMAKAKAADVLPLQVGNAQGHAAFIVQSIGQSVDGATNAAKWAFGTKGSTFDTEGNKLGVQKLQKWSKLGYIPDAANSVDLQGAVAKFGAGEGLFFVDGNWDASKISDALNADAGFAVFPGKSTTAIGSSVGYAISAKSKNKDTSAAFLNFMNSPEAAKLQFEQGFLPADTTVVSATPGTVQVDLLKAFGELRDADGIVPFNNNATATMDKALTAETQRLLGGQSTTDEFIKAIQDNWTKVHH
ncbi:ABC transporter substrate-binding protein [Arthrobacter sp. ISL-72]|uniref:ABC transporter substrate-binding protein n=1 Tax=Arthrobacter sp. ISL-72 TaxID=2819114 RepID=UPI001BE64BD1|nr:extracellular solute-binding protein [Arthrobacter sp. ISL-72]MBT2598100.1 extracellular solute-binding protein [Arthrobacter sp. ISL-72]